MLARRPPVWPELAVRRH